MPYKIMLNDFQIAIRRDWGPAVRYVRRNEPKIAGKLTIVKIESGPVASAGGKRES